MLNLRRPRIERMQALDVLLQGDDTALQIDLEGNVRHHLQLEDH